MTKRVPRKSVAFGFILSIALVASLSLSDCSSHGFPETAPAKDPASQVKSFPSPTRDARTEIGFASHERLIEHYRKHGPEFGSITLDEYLRRAQSLRDSAVGGNVLEVVRSDGVITRFDRATGAFIAFNSDGTIRTFFRPNAGEAYFRRQSEREE